MFRYVCFYYLRSISWEVVSFGVFENVNKIVFEVRGWGGSENIM